MHRPMQKVWVHNDLRLAGSSARVHGARRTLSRSMLATKRVSSPFVRKITALCCATSLAGIAFGIGSLVYVTAGSRSPQAIEEFLPVLGKIKSVAWDHSRFISSINVEHQRKLAPQVRFVSNIIRSKSRVENPRDLARSIVEASVRENYDPLFVTAVIKHESTFNKLAHSSAGAVGLMQIIPSTGEYIARLENRSWDGALKLREPSYNIELGITYFRYLEDLFRGNREHALIAYNWGPQNLMMALKNKTAIPSSPRQYAQKILSTHERWTMEYRSQLATSVDSTKFARG